MNHFLSDADIEQRKKILNNLIAHQVPKKLAMKGFTETRSRIRKLSGGKQSGRFRNDL